MKLDVGGEPIHTRSLGVALAWRADGRLDLRGQLLDLRKRGCVPVVGGLQGSGLIHHMRVHGVIDPAARRLLGAPPGSTPVHHSLTAMRSERHIPVTG